MDNCDCPDPALCSKLKRHIRGRLWEIWNGKNVDAATAAQYRISWERRAALQDRKIPLALRNPPCVYLQEANVIDRRNRVCQHCWIRGCEKFGQCTTGEEVAGTHCCKTCDAYVPEEQ